MKNSIILALFSLIVFTGCGDVNHSENQDLMSASKKHLPMNVNRYYVSGDTFYINQVIPPVNFIKEEKEPFRTSEYILTSLDGGNCITFKDFHMSFHTTICNGYTIQTKVK